MKPAYLVLLKLAGQATSPLPAGEAIRAILLHRELGIDHDKAFGPVITQAFLELISNAFLVIIGSFIFQKFRVTSLLILFLIILLIIFLTQKNFIKFLKEKANKNGLAYKIFEKLSTTQDNIRKEMFIPGKYYPNLTFIKCIGLAIITNIIGGVIIFMIAKQLNIDLNILQCVFIYSSTIVIGSFTTVIPGGLGFIEGGMASLLLVFRVGSYEGFALILILVFRAVTLLFYILLGVVFFIIFYLKDFIFKDNQANTGKSEDK